MTDNLKNLGKVCITPEGVWDVNKEYDRLSLVVTKDSDTQRVLSYISRKHVPKGNISINNTEYWQLFTTELKLEDITIDENGNVKIGDVVIYQIPLGDALGEIVVDKIKADLTNHIMTEIRSYMNGMVQELINSFSNQIGRLITNGIDIRNKISGELNNRNSGGIGVGLTSVNLNENRNSGEVDLHHDGNLQIGVNGNVNGQHTLMGNVGLQDNRTEPIYHNIKVTTTPAAAKVTLNGIEAKDWNFVEGSTIFIVASMKGYVTKTQTINSLTEDTTVTISLEAKPDVYTFSAQPLNNTIGASGGAISAVVVSLKNNENIDYSYRKIDADNIINNITKNGNNLLITVKENTTTSVKNASIELTQSGSSDTLIILINQSAGSDTPPTPADTFVFTCNKNSINVNSDAATTEINVVSTKNGTNIGYSANSSANWVSLTNNIISIQANTSENNRTATITLIQNESSNTLTINVTQSGSGSSSDEFVFESNRSNIIATSLAGNNAISLTSTKNGELIGFTTTNKPEWITVSSYENGTRHEVTLLLAANNSENDRTGTVTFTQNESGNTVTIDVTQYGTEHVVVPTHMVDVTVINGVTQEEIPTAHIYINNVESSNRTVDEGTDVSVRVNAEGYIARDIVERPITQQDPLVQADYEHSETINDISQDAYITVELYPEPDRYVFTANTEATPNKTLNYGANVQIFGTPLTSTKNGSQIGYVVTSQPEWVTSINTQQNGNISGNMTANNSANSRVGDIILTQNESGKIVQISIVQAGTGSGGDTDEFVFTSDKSAIQFRAAAAGGGAEAPIEVTIVSTKNGSDIEYTAQSSANWVSFSKPRAGVGAVAVTENISENDRTATITLTQNESGETLTISITQSGANSGGDSGGEGGDSDTYVLEATPDTLSFDAGTNLTNTVNVVSTKNGSSQPFSVTNKPNWLNTSINNGVLTITAELNLNNENRTGSVEITQTDNSTPITIEVTQAAAQSLPAGSEFVGMLASNGQPVEQSLTTPIRFSLSDNISKTLIPRLKVNGSLTDDTLIIPSSGYASGATNTDKFTILNSNNALSITPNGTPSESITTSYEIYVMHNNYVGHYTFEVHWDA